MTATEDWRAHARRLARQLVGCEVLRDAAWRAAIEMVPRHVFVPRFYDQQPGGEWAETTAESDGWLEAVYQDVPLVTALAETADGARVTVSSSTKPGLMARMLAVLDVRDRDRVLEIGTGTGYNAALLSHRLGDEHVFSVDISADFVEMARERLAELGYAPTLAVGHGARGLAEHAPFDRIIATCSVPAVPRAWSEQLCDGGLLLVYVKHGSVAGNLVLLRKLVDRLEGRFLPRWAGFMAMRDTDSALAETAGLAAVRPEDGERSFTRLDPAPWATVVPWFLASSRLPRKLEFGYVGRTASGAPEWAILGGDDGSWCAVRMQPGEHGHREVREGGPVAIWAQFERAHAEWEAHGRPGWDRLGLTVTPDGLHRVWLDSPDGTPTWDLHGSARTP